MKKLVFATSNPNKIREIKDKLGDNYTFLSLDDINCHEEIPETTGTIPGNAHQKAQYVFDQYQIDCFAEDSGLIIDALDGRPGVDTAHYSGSRDAKANNQKVLEELKGIKNRKAKFVANICLIIDGKSLHFEGEVHGSIAEEEQGDGGFGYDPIFIPNGHGDTFAILSKEIKKDISHRAKAVEKLIKYLNEYK